jgi:hypothetical protein
MTCKTRSAKKTRSTGAGQKSKGLFASFSEHTAKYGHDLDRICEALRERQNSSARKVVSLPPRLLRDKHAAN